MDRIKRYEMVRAMETIARSINDEEVFEEWLLQGVPDGQDMTSKGLDYLIERDEEFADIMYQFLKVMNNARKNGGIYCDNVTDKKQA